MVTGVLTPAFTDMDVSIPEWVASGKAERFLIEVGKKKGIAITKEQAENWWNQYMYDFSAEMYEATVKSVEETADGFKKGWFDDDC